MAKLHVGPCSNLHEPSQDIKSPCTSHMESQFFWASEVKLPPRSWNCRVAASGACSLQPATNLGEFEAPLGSARAFGTYQGSVPEHQRCLGYTRRATVDDTSAPLGFCISFGGGLQIIVPWSTTPSSWDSLCQYAKGSSGAQKSGQRGGVQASCGWRSPDPSRPDSGRSSRLWRGVQLGARYFFPADTHKVLDIKC